MNKTKNLPNTAVILAAGDASRLGEISQHLPKALLKIGEKPMVWHSIDKLLSAGVKHIKLVVNSKFSQEFEFLKIIFPSLEVVITDRPKDFGNSYSLFVGTKDVAEPFLIIDGDIAFEKRALTELAKSTAPNMIIVSGPTNSKDEVWVSGENGKLISISKFLAQPNKLVGEFIGISKVSIIFLNFVRESTATKKTLFLKDYEYFLNEFAQFNSIEICFVNDLIWGEVDTLEHLNKMTSETFPAILTSEIE